MTLRKWTILGTGLVGFVFMLQGLGLTVGLYPSLMNNDIRWSLVGIGMMIVALVLWQRKD